MSYAQGEAAALTIIQGLTGDYSFNDDNSLSTANDDENKGVNLINNGKAYYYCFLEPGEFTSDRVSLNQSMVVTQWQTVIRLMCFGNPKTKESPIQLLVAVREVLIARMDTYMELDSTTGAYAKITSGGTVDRWLSNGNATPFVSQELILSWEEVSTITQND